MQLFSNARTWLIIALLAVIGTVCYLNFEWVEEQIELGLSAEAMQEPFLAVQRLAKANKQTLAFSTEYPRLFSEQTQSSILPAKNGALILAHSDQLLNMRQAKAIVAWVEQGGHLILAVDAASVRQPRDIHDPLWQRLAIGVQDPLPVEADQDVETPASEADVKTQHSAPEDSLEESDDKPPSKAELEQIKLELHGTKIITSEGEMFYANLEKSYRILIPQAQPLDLQAGDERGITFAQFALKKGKVSVLTDVDIWNNLQLRSAHNAYFYTWLTQPNEAILLMYSNRAESWLIRLAQWSPMLMVCILFWLLFFVWRQAVRFGPAYSVDASQQHFFDQHIEAAGDYYWKNAQSATLLQPLQQEVLELANRRWPRFSQFDKAEQVARLHQHSGLDIKEIDTALFTTSHNNEKYFSAQVSLLQKLRKTV